LSRTIRHHSASEVKQEEQLPRNSPINNGKTLHSTSRGGPSVAPIPLTPDAGFGQGVFTVNRDLRSGYAQQWSLAIQRELTHNISFEVAYVGSHITHVAIPDVNISQFTVDQLAAGSPLIQKVGSD
jgi:hypothetical protein